MTEKIRAAPTQLHPAVRGVTQRGLMRPKDAAVRLVEAALVLRVPEAVAEPSHRPNDLQLPSEIPMTDDRSGHGATLANQALNAVGVVPVEATVTMMGGEIAKVVAVLRVSDGCSVRALLDVLVRRSLSQRADQRLVVRVNRGQVRDPFHVLFRIPAVLGHFEQATGALRDRFDRQLREPTQAQAELELQIVTAMLVEAPLDLFPLGRFPLGRSDQGAPCHAGMTNAHERAVRQHRAEPVGHRSVRGLPATRAHGLTERVRVRPNAVHGPTPARFEMSEVDLVVMKIVTLMTHVRGVQDGEALPVMVPRV